MCDNQCDCERAPPQCCFKPSFFQKLNCVPCNRLFFFVLGWGATWYFEKIRNSPAPPAPPPDNKKTKAKKEKEKKEKEKKEKKEKERREKEKKSNKK